MFLLLLKNHLYTLQNSHNKFILFTSFPGIEKPLLTEGQGWIGVQSRRGRCSYLRITKVNKDGTFTAQYTPPPGYGPDFAVTGHHNTAGSVISFSMSHKSDYFDSESVSAYAGHVKKNGDVILTTYLMSHNGGETEVGFEEFYSSTPMACPVK